MHEIPWYVVIDPIQCSVVEVGKSAWRIAVQVDSKQYLVDFEDDLPSTFLSEEVAQIVYKNLGDALAYLRSEEEKQVQNLPAINWSDTPPDARFQERRFDNGIWGVVAVLPEGDHLILFTKFDGEAGIRTFYQDRESIQEALTFLQFLESLTPDPQVKKQPRAVSTPPFVPDPHLLDVPRDVIEGALEEIDYIAMGWLGHLGRGKRFSCLCLSCRHWYVRRLDRLLDYLLDQYQGVPWEIQDAVQQVQDDWAKKERSKISSF